MSRTVLAFERFGDDVMLKLDDAPLDVDGLGENERVDVAQVSGGTLVERGEALRELLFSNPAVKAALTAVLAAPPGSAPFPLYFHIRAALADGVPWEEIHADEQGFFALDQRWPIGRIAARARPLTERVFVPPLRIVAVLSAAGRSGLDQLRALLTAVAGDDATELGVQLHVISGDQAVLDAAVGPGVTSDLIAPNGPGLARQITKAKPHLLHALCHGGVVAGARTLAFAHLADFDAQPPDSPPAAGAVTDVGGSVRLTVPDLVSALLPCDPWLVVLSACQTADANGVQDGPALAHEVVSGGIPAVIGMRRLVDLGETNRFCRALYPEVMSTLRTALAPSDVGQDQPSVRDVDWAGVLTGPRKVLGDPDPAQKDAWTDPVLYVQDQPMKIVRWPTRAVPNLSPAEYATLRAKIDEYREFLTRLDPATAAPGLIGELRARIDEMESSLPKAPA